MADRVEPVWAGGAIALLLAAALAAQALGEPYYLTLAAKVAILALAAAGLNIALGFGGMVSLGHAAFFGLGGYVAGISATHAFEGTPLMAWPVAIPATDQMPAIWLAAILLGALLALAIGALSLRMQGVTFIMITLAYSQMVYYFAISWPAYGGEDGLPIYVRNAFPGLDTNAPEQFFALAIGALVLCLLLSARLKSARFGEALAMARMNETRLAAAGIAPFPVRLAAFVLSGAVTALAGALFADLNGFVGPSMLSWQRSGELIVIVILGGVGRVGGPVIGALVFIGLETWLGGLTDRWQFFLGLVLLALTLSGRGGVIGIVEALMQRRGRA